jgi:hypothetical protein
MRSTLSSGSRPGPRSWLGVKGKPADIVCGELRLRQSSWPDDDRLKSPIVGASANEGWYLIVIRGREHRLIADAVIEPLSVGCEVLTCTSDEQNIFSAAAAWRNGSRLWAVSYDGEEASELQVHGTLSPSLTAIRERFTALAQAPDAGDALVDPMYEIAIEMVQSVIGYKPFDKSPAFHGRFVELQGLDTPLWKRLVFGG